MVDYIQQNNISTHLIDIVLQMQNGGDVVSEVLNSFESVSLTEMGGVKLMNRVDTKFLINSCRLASILNEVKEHYSVLEIDGFRTTPYSTIYFDTPDLMMYTMHHNGKRDRHKIRMRVYENSQQSFLEVKHKNNKGRTNKKRVGIDYEQFKSMTFREEQAEFLKKRLPYNKEQLQPTLQNYFKRITLVDKNKTERITIDLGLRFRNVETDTTVPLGQICIIEIKQDGACKSYFRSVLDKIHILPGSMSKYCLGMVLVKPGIKSNRFKNKLRMISKITKTNYVTN